MAGVQTVLRFFGLFVTFGQITGQYLNAREINSRTAVAEEALNKKRFLPPANWMQFRERTSRTLHLERSFVW